MNLLAKHYDKGYYARTLSWTRYQKLKFDDYYGKDSVPRYPRCNEARLFDEEGMSRFQSKLLAQCGHDAQVVGGAAGGNRQDVVAGNTNHLERAFSMLRQGRRNAEVVPGAAAASNQNVESNNSPPEEEGDNTREKEPQKINDDKILNGDNSPASSQIDNIKACSTQD